MSSIYTKLTARNRGLTGYSQLWLAPDHLLLLTSTRLSEEYKRFAFSDIQSIVVTERPPRVVLQVIMVLAALAMMSMWFSVESVSAKLFFEITGALMLLIPIVDIARGARCRCFLHTRVSGELLTPVSRMKTARAFLATVRPLIEAVQGVLPMDGTVLIETPPSAWETPPPDLATSPGYVPEVLFGTFLLNAVMIWASVQFPKVQEILGVLITTLFAEILLIAVALVRRRGRDTRVVIYVLIALAIVGFGFDIVTIGRELGNWYLNVIDKAKSGDKAVPPMSLFPAGGHRATIAYSWRAAVGIFGLAASYFERRRK
jgi:hypothetical protein